MKARGTAVLGLALLCGCDAELIFPADYQAEGYLQARNCVYSIDHSLEHGVTWVDPATPIDYCSVAPDMPPGATLLMALYSDDDDACAGPELRTLAMRKEPPGTSPASADWTFQEVSSSGHVRRRPGPVHACVGCHPEGPACP
ncbi:MAG TPA: hypothetical protein VG389_25395 [Myxococcota bacterium]|nr:hypothetical protein [Myxococcota bacterium]